MNSWPNPDKPGVPLHPERHGWHWLAWDPTWPEPAYWDGEWSQSESSNLNAKTARYMGPLYTPAEVAAREAAAAEEMRAICARAAMVELGWNNGSVEARKAIAMQAAHTVNAIRERPIPSSDTLAAMLAQARREGMEEAAQEVDCGCDIRDAVLARLESQGEKRASYLCTHGDVCSALQAAAIRAAAKENP